MSKPVIINKNDRDWLIGRLAVPNDQRKNTEKVIHSVIDDDPAAEDKAVLQALLENKPEALKFPHVRLAQSNTVDKMIANGFEIATTDPEAQDVICGRDMVDQHMAEIGQYVLSAIRNQAPKNNK